MSETSVPFEREPCERTWTEESPEDPTWLNRLSHTIVEGVCRHHTRELQKIQIQLDLLLKSLACPYDAKSMRSIAASVGICKLPEEIVGMAHSPKGQNDIADLYDNSRNRSDSSCEMVETAQSQNDIVDFPRQSSSFNEQMGRRLSEMSTVSERRKEWTMFLHDFIKEKTEKASGKMSRKIRFLAIPPDTRLARCVTSTSFNSIVVVLVVINVFCIGLETECDVRRDLQSCPTDSVFAFFSVLFAMVFLFEVILKAVALRWSFLFAPGWGMNLLDVALVLSTALEVVDGISLRHGRVFRAFRMARVLRIMRILAAFRPLRKIVCCLYSSFGALWWSLIMMLVMIYVFSLLLMQGVKFCQDAGDCTHELRNNFGSINSSMLTLFYAITGGLDWYDVANSLGRVQYVLSYVFVFYIFLMHFGIMNVLIGVFCEAASEANALDADLLIHRERVWMDQTLRRLQFMFMEIDEDEDGVINWYDFKQYAQNEEVLNYLMSQGVNIFDATGIFELLTDTARTGQYIDEVSFVLTMLSTFGRTKNTDIMMLKEEMRQTSAQMIRMEYKNRLLLSDHIAKERTHQTTPITTPCRTDAS